MRAEIRYDFIPGTLDHSSVDEWVKTNDDDAWPATRQAMRFEGLLVGGSSGSVLAGALRWLKSEEGFKKYGGVEGVNVVILFPDGYVSPSCHGCIVTDMYVIPFPFLLLPVDANDAGYGTICRSHGSKALSTGLALHLSQHKLLKPSRNLYHRARRRFMEMETRQLPRKP